MHYINATSLPLYHLDKHFFVEYWQERNYADFLDIQRTLVDQENWIIDGNATRSLDIRWLQADMVIYLNFSRPTCYLRVFKRLIKQGLLNNKSVFDDRAEHCPEQVSWKLLKYMYSFDDRVHTSINLMKELHPDTPFYEIHTDKELGKLFCLLTKIV